jgi:transcriptional regulator with XRE-family HTH domain
MVSMEIKKWFIIAIMSKKVDFKVVLGNYIRRKRLEKGWSQSDLAAKLGNNYQNVSRLERGKTSPTFEWCYHLADAFNMDMVDFVNEMETNYKILPNKQSNKDTNNKSFSTEE